MAERAQSNARIHFQATLCMPISTHAITGAREVRDPWAVAVLEWLAGRRFSGLACLLPDTSSALDDTASLPHVQPLAPQEVMDRTLGLEPCTSSYF